MGKNFPSHLGLAAGMTKRWRGESKLPSNMAKQPSPGFPGEAEIYKMKLTIAAEQQEISIVSYYKAWVSWSQTLMQFSFKYLPLLKTRESGL